MPTSRQAYFQQEHHQHDRDDAFPSSPPAYFDRRGSNPDAHQHAVFPAEPTSPRRLIRFQAYASCYECAVAQQICTRWEEVREGTRNSRKDTEIEKGHGSRGGTRKFEKRYGSSSGLMAGFGSMMVSGVGCVPKGREQAEEVEEE